MYKADTVFSTAIFGGRRGISHTGCAQTRSKSRYFRVVRNPEKKGGTSCAECGASVGQLHPRRKQAALTLLFFEQRTDKTVQPLRTAGRRRATPYRIVSGRISLSRPVKIAAPRTLRLRRTAQTPIIIYRSPCEANFGKTYSAKIPPERH